MIKMKEKRMIFLLAGMLLAIGILGAMAWRYYFSPSSTFTLDVNPSIELQTDRLNQVVAVNPVNEDARQLLAGYELKDNNLEAVIKSIVDRMILNGYLTQDKDNEILLTTEEGSSVPLLSESIHQIINTYLDERQIAANTILQTVNATAQELQTASEYNLSVGKLRLIEELMSNDSSLTIGALSGMRISDLLALKDGKDSNTQEALAADAITASPTIAVSEDTTEADDQDLEDADEADDQDHEDSNIEDSDEKDAGTKSEKKVVRSYSSHKSSKEDASEIENKNENDSDAENEDYDLEENDQEDGSREDGQSVRKESGDEDQNDNEDQDDNESRYEKEDDGEDGGRHAIYSGEDNEDNGASVESDDQGENED